MNSSMVLVIIINMKNLSYIDYSFFFHQRHNLSLFLTLES